MSARRVKRAIRIASFRLLAFCGSKRAFGQYRSDRWTTENGLPQNTANAIAQTRDGYIWFTTFDGLVRFDGVRFTVFDRSNTKALATNRFTDSSQDPLGTLWTGTQTPGL